MTTALELYNRPITGIKYVIESVIPAVSFNILAGQEKDGKSTLATQFALDIAAGNKVMGNFKTIKSEVSFLSLEEEEKLSEDRIKFICQDTAPSPGVDYRFEFPSLEEGGLDRLEAYLEKNTNIKVVVIDTFAKFCGDRINRRHGHLTEGQIARRIHKMTKIYGVAIIAIHHTVKNLTGTLRDVRGNGVNTQIADNILMLTSDKSRGIAKLRRIGRYGDADYSLKYNKDRHCWDFLGEFDDTMLTPEREAVLEIMVDAYGPIQVKDIAKGIGKKVPTISNLLKKLSEQGLVARCDYGIYEITDEGKIAITTL